MQIGISINRIKIYLCPAYESPRFVQKRGDSHISTTDTGLYWAKMKQGENLNMILKAILSNRTHPKYGQATIPLPIPDSEYDHTITLLEAIEIGSPTARDCRADQLDSDYPVLNRLAAQSVNLDELDYLAKRLESFCESEKGQFQAMASKLRLSDIKDFINLTFCCQEATVITDFSDLERIGKNHSLTINGGMMLMEELNQVDGLAVALDLIQSGAGEVTPYGVVYDNGMKLEQIYAGASFPQYLYKDPLLTLGVPIQPEIDGPVETAWLYLPAPGQQIVRTLRRIGITNSDAAYYIEDSTLPPKIFEILERPDDTIPELNRLCQVMDGLDAENLTKLEAVVMMAQPKEAGEIRHLAENLDQFDFVPGVQSPEQNSQVNKLGYAVYHGSSTLEELMQDDPSEPRQQGPALGGICS